MPRASIRVISFLALMFPKDHLGERREGVITSRLCNGSLSSFGRSVFDLLPDPVLCVLLVLL